MKKNVERVKKQKKKIDRTKVSMTLFFVFGFAIVLFLSEIITATLEYVFTKTEILTIEKLRGSQLLSLLIWSTATLIVGMAFAFLVSKIILKPLNRLLIGLKKLSEGDYTVRLKVGGEGAFSSVESSFNKLAEELEKTEILRSDFVNSFSHEFKTPINSINGLVSLIKKGNLSKQKQKEYLDVIAEEVARLSKMTTNILNLTKYESQGILTGVSTFNLSEQIRTCILLFEKKWQEKELELSIDFEEFNVQGSEDMLLQVWMNLIDNAVKFSPKGGVLAVRIKQEEGFVHVEIENEGEGINEDDQARVFAKFYQADATHANEGNGIGLSIVKRIVELHKGKIALRSENKKTVFEVKLPA